MGKSLLDIEAFQKLTIERIVSARRNEGKLAHGKLQQHNCVLVRLPLLRMGQGISHSGFGTTFSYMEVKEGDYLGE
jgi:chloramphenicol O-acetyltransferase